MAQFIINNILLSLDITHCAEWLSSDDFLSDVTIHLFKTRNERVESMIMPNDDNVSVISKGANKQNIPIKRCNNSSFAFCFKLNALQFDSRLNCLPIVM